MLPLELADSGLLSIELLFRNGVLRQQRRVPLEIQLSVRQQCFVVRQLPLGLLEHHLIGPGIDEREILPFFYVIPFLESHGHQFAIDERPDRGCMRRPKRCRGP